MICKIFNNVVKIVPRSLGNDLIVSVILRALFLPSGQLKAALIRYITSVSCSVPKDPEA